MISVNLSQLNYFRTLARYEHYSYAAAELGISQSALSQSMSALERELGVYLFEKRGRNISLTQNGLIFLKYVDEALNAVEAGRQELKKMNSPKSGRVSLGIISGVAHFIPPLLSDFIKNHADVSFSCDYGTTDFLLQELKKEGLDLVICSRRQEETAVKFIPIVEGQVIVLFPPNHPLADKKEIFLKDIASQPIILHTNESGMRRVTENLFARFGLTPKVAMEAQDDLLIAKMVESGHGIAIITNLPEIKKCRIKTVPLADTDVHRFIYLAFLNNRPLAPAAQSFKSFVLGKPDLQDMFDESCRGGAA